MAGVNAYKDGVVARLYKGLQGLVKRAKITVRRGRRPAGRARTPSRSTASATPAATSCWPPARTRAALPGLEIDGERVITSEHALELDRVPASAIVLGGGVIGVEFASAWKSFGADVTIVEALPRLVAAEDEECSKALERAFRKRGIAFKVGKPFEKVEHTETGVRVTIAGGETVEAELLLVAVGRGPTTAEPRVRGAGRHAWTAASSSPTSGCAPTCRNVYAVGDIVPGLQLAHRGFQQGIFVAEEIAGRNPPSIDEDGIPRVTYCDPEVASVGLTEAKAKEQYGADKVADVHLQPRRQRQEPDPQDRRASSSWSGSPTARSSASTWSAPGSASWSARRS